jgi:hypothetical protein
MKVVFTLELTAHTTLGCINVVCLFVMLRPPNSQGSMTKGCNEIVSYCLALKWGVIGYSIILSRKFNRIT